MTPLGPIVQVAYFVPDARAAAARMAASHGAGPFHVLDRIELAWGELRGEPCDFVHTSAYGQWGGVMMELVQQDVEGPSPFREMYAPGEGGIHHVATMVDDLAATYERLAASGLELAARAMTRTGTEFAFVDTVDTQGHMTEIYERAPALLGFYEMVRSAADGWDGSDPVRTLG
ncbi:MAG: VOC family protein [Actinomycetota bacterium]